MPRIAPFALCLLCVAAFGQTGFPVILDDHVLYTVSPKDRADDVSKSLQSSAEDPAAPALRLVAGQSESIVLSGRTFICQISDADAVIAGRSRSELAADRLRIITEALTQHRQAHRALTLTRNVAVTLGIWFLFALFVTLLHWLYKCALHAFLRQYDTWTALKNWFGIGIPFAVRFVLLVAAALLGVVAFSTGLSHSLSLYPATAGYSRTFLQFFEEAFAAGLRRVIAYLPDLAVALILLAGTWYLIRFLHFLARRIEKGELTVPGFHPDFAWPTARILSFLLVMGALVAIFPYLPGGDSPALRGVSIFIGVLVSFGSGSAMGNLIAGILLTYMRPFQIGDRVKLADNIGDIVEQSLLVTRIRTIKNVEIVVPNSLILNAHILNYSAEAKGRGLILNTSITIGYDAPWRKVQQLLIEAALATDGILAEPNPFVFQTALNDFNVSYEINAYTRNPNGMAHIYSDLHANIQECFNRGGIEIMSPNYLAYRDGNDSTISK